MLGSSPADAATVKRIAERMEMRGRDPTFTRFRQAYIDALGLAPGQRWLDIGSGTGVTTRLLQRTCLDIQTVGVDPNAAIVELSRQLAKEAGLDQRSTYEVGRAEMLPFPDHCFDGAIADTLVAQLDDAAPLISEAQRVLRPGGRLALFEGDYGTLTFGGIDSRLSEEVVTAIRHNTYKRPTGIREVPALLHAAGMQIEAIIPSVYLEVGTGEFFWSYAQTYAPLVAKSGLITQARADEWLAELKRAQDDRKFFAACNYYAFVARRSE